MHLIKSCFKFTPTKLVMSLVFSLLFLITGCGSGGGNPENKTGVLAPSSVAITPANSTVTKGSTTNFTATATYIDGSIVPITSGIIWEIANTAIATIDSSTGAAKGVAQGDTTVKATVSGVSSPLVNLHVTDAVILSINISTTTPTVPKGRAADFVATAGYSDGQSGNVTGSVTWASANPVIATPDNIVNKGRVATLAQGNTNISASTMVGTTLVQSSFVNLKVDPPALDTISISPSPANITVLGTKQFIPSGVMTDGTVATLGALVWTSTNPAATISSTGIATGISTGSSSISASSAGVTSNIVTLNVNPGSLLGGSIQGNNLTLTTVVTTLAGTALAPGSYNGPGNFARFYNPVGITTDGNNLYVADMVNKTIRKIVIATGAVTILAGSVWVSGSTDATGDAARFSNPTGITTDGLNLYVVDSQNHTIRKIVITTREVTTLAGTAGVSGSTDASGAAARFNFPAGITTDGSNLYVVDRSNHTIRKIEIATGAVTTLAGIALATGSTDATGTAARFNAPSGITTDGSNLYVADRNNHTIRKIVKATREVTTLAGVAGISGSTDASGANARFSGPEGIVTDGFNLYVADSGNHTIRKIVISTGAVTTLAGFAGAIESTDATGTAARFNYPTGIATDGTNLYVADYFNHTIRKIQ